MENYKHIYLLIGILYYQIKNLNEAPSTQEVCILILQNNALSLH